MRNRRSWMDAGGVIDEVGAGSPWAIGDEVMAIALPLGEHGGAYAEYLVGPSESMARIPVNSELVAASTLPMNGLTAMQILEKLALHPGQTLAVTGAAGTLGTYVIQLAKHEGLTVIADAAEKDRALVQGAGADHVVARGEDVAEQIRTIFPEGVDGLVDAALMSEKAVPAVRDSGGFVSVRFGWQSRPTRGIVFDLAAVFDEYRPHDKLDALRRHVEDGVVTLRVADVLSADDAVQAHRRLEVGGVRGRLVLTF